MSISPFISREFTCLRVIYVSILRHFTTFAVSESYALFQPLLYLRRFLAAPPYGSSLNFKPNALEFALYGLSHSKEGIPNCSTAVDNLFL